MYDSLPCGINGIDFFPKVNPGPKCPRNIKSCRSFKIKFLPSSGSFGCNRCVYCSVVRFYHRLKIGVSINSSCDVHRWQQQIKEKSGKNKNFINQLHLTQIQTSKIMLRKYKRALGFKQMKSFLHQPYSLVKIFHLCILAYHYVRMNKYIYLA